MESLYGTPQQKALEILSARGPFQGVYQFHISKFLEFPRFSIMIQSKFHDCHVCMENTVHCKQTRVEKKTGRSIKVNIITRRTQNVLRACDNCEKTCKSGQNKTPELGSEQVSCLMFRRTRKKTHKLRVTADEVWRCLRSFDIAVKAAEKLRSGAIWWHSCKMKTQEPGRFCHWSKIYFTIMAVAHAG